MTRERQALDDFAAHGDIIHKPFGNGGAGVFRVRADDENFGSLIDMFAESRHC